MTAGPDQPEEVAMTDSTGQPPAVRCGACGAAPAAPETAEDEAAEPITHCEWCGAEYPTPSGK